MLFCAPCKSDCCEPTDVHTPRNPLNDAEKQQLREQSEESEESVNSKKEREASNEKLQSLNREIYKWHVKGAQRLNSYPSKLHMARSLKSKFIDTDKTLNSTFNTDEM